MKPESRNALQVPLCAIGSSLFDVAEWLSFRRPCYIGVGFIIRLEFELEVPELA